MYHFKENLSAESSTPSGENLHEGTAYSKAIQFCFV